ncbi:cadherin-like beta sandwich domain-containing protein [Carboxylicivirga linearis]|uniref:Cadherin-like beta sandwich domain-containing protein n=1 Tax=Carboxylicivirga linearis TaxID=1628157 RepID=A0ABS5JWU0_9BACT|nr:cadherin-like beta sandwich domain-containing protein [Carboxylicivirga linearis]MBS2099392.1 cadherin-like beta sandwich domain-containing protein [Carboxylicivirga linearis]
MKKRFLLLKFWYIFIVLATVSTASLTGQTLMHSYTFEDGTFEGSTVFDQTGDLDGTLGGDRISIADGMCTVSGATANNHGWISLDGTALALNTYTAITFEAFLVAGDNENGSFTMLGYFGTSTPGNGCFWYQPSRSGNESRAETNNTSTTITAAVPEVELDDGKMHHVVVVLTGTELSYYLDGALLAQTSTEGADFIGTIGTDVANFFRGVDGWNDPNYNGSVDEFNIYDGAMDQTTIESRWVTYVGEDYLNADLASISCTPGDLTPTFDPAELDYTVYVPYGDTTTVISVETAADVASYTIYTYDGTVVGDDGVVTFTEDGENLTIYVTALSGDEKYYYVDVYQYPEKTSERLSDIEVTGGTLIGDFNPDSTSYNIRADYGATLVEITGVPFGSGATVTGDGVINLTDGVGSATIHVVSEDANSEMDYNVTIYATEITTGVDYYLQHEASGYVVGESGEEYNMIKIYEPYNEPTQLFQFVSTDVAGQYYIQNKNGNYLRLAPKNGDQVWDMIMQPTIMVEEDSCRFELNEFEQGRFQIVSVARANEFENVFMGTNNSNLFGGVYSDKWDGNEMAYWSIVTPDQIDVQYNTYLESLSVLDNALIPSFDATVTEYRVVLPEGTAQFTVEAIAQHVSATVAGAGTIDVAAEGEGSVTVTVTNGGQTRDYVISYVLYSEDFALMHSYTFLDGTAKDEVSGADGVVYGGAIDQGVFTASQLGEYIELPAGDIAINTYTSVTFEHFIRANTEGANTNSNTMISAFGRSDGYGYDYFFTSAKSRAAISATVTENPWENESGVTGTDLDADLTGALHHLVAIITKDALYFYVDGSIAGDPVALNENNRVEYLSNEVAYLFKSVYPNDNTWIGSIEEFNIYAGVMDDATILENSIAGPKAYAGNDATLSDLTVNGVTIEGFHSATFNYMVTVEEGVTPVIVATTKEANATYEVNGPSAIPGTATVVVTAADGETTNTYTIEFDTATGIGSSTEGGIKVYPTVSTGEFTVEMEGQTSLITVYDLAGRLVKQVKSNTQREIISIDQKGMYIVKVESDGDTKLFKVFKR